MTESEWKIHKFETKTMAISNAQEAIKAAGFVSELKNFDNAHIQATSKHGKKMNYYATTGTITGYGNTQIEGLDAFINLLRNI